MRAVVVAGGTGGHIYPALAIINKIKEREPDSEILYFGTTDRMEKDIIPSKGIPYIGLEMSGLNRKNPFGNIKVLKKFFKAYGRNPEELVFYLKDQNFDKEAEEAGTRYEIRRRYWDFALQYIKSAHGTEGSFKNVTTSKQYWINGSK